MNIFEQLNVFWEKNEFNPCSLSEISLYFYLLYESNRQHWVSPFKVSTQILAARLCSSKQNVIKARDGLMEKGLISFTKGYGKGAPALYKFLSSGNDMQSQELTKLLSQTITQELTQKVTDTLPLTLSPSNNKEKNIYYEKKNEKAIVSPPLNKKLTIEELQTILINDTEWQTELTKLLSDAGINLGETNLKRKIEDFFNYLRIKQVSHKELVDCRIHFLNWIKYKKKKYGTESNDNKIGGAQITNNRPEDYQGAC